MPGTGRRGPEDLWERFDAAVAALNRAITGSSAETVARAFGGLADVTSELADAVARDDEDSARVADRLRRRGAA
jgi:ABC-type xylose transport system substrate-binding protein